MIMGSVLSSSSYDPTLGLSHRFKSMIRLLDLEAKLRNRKCSQYNLSDPIDTHQRDPLGLLEHEYPIKRRSVMSQVYHTVELDCGIFRVGKPTRSTGLEGVNRYGSTIKFKTMTLDNASTFTANTLHRK